jgi:hypothetical protein
MARMEILRKEPAISAMAGSMSAARGEQYRWDESD